MAKPKIDFKALGTKAAGLAMGTIGAGFALSAINKITNSEGQPALNAEMQGAALIGIGAFAPDLLGKKNQMFSSAGDAVMVKGVDMLLRRFFPNAIKGLDDMVAGGDYVYGPESINDMDFEEDGIVSGPESYDSVAGNVGNTL